MTELFDVGTSRIDPGIALIEASAGTGKTFAIAGISVRLIAEKGYALSEILVVTFTEAATQELRDRVRSRIRQAILLLEEGRPGEDPALKNFAGANEEKIAEAIRRLKNSLLAFDEAAIFTIHGFCQRMLRENAFETGALFDVELLTDAESIWRETAEDFWRKEFYNADPELASVVVALQKKLSVGDLVELLRKLSRHPNLKIVTGDERLSMEECQAELLRAIAQLRSGWGSSSTEVADILKSTNALSRSKSGGYPPEAIDQIVGNLRALEADSPLPPPALESLQRLSARQLEANTTRKRPAPEHPFFDLCAELEELLETFLRLVRRRFIDRVRTGLAEAKKRRNVITFDDLLTRLYEALRGPGGEALASAIGGRFKAALIDEFQDTDPVQWEIFHRVFGSEGHLLFLIGDPKQAIYGFRGADIFTYMKARAEARTSYTLGTNWRSDKPLIEAANQLFAQNKELFVFPEITFHPVEAAPKEGGAGLELAGSGVNPEPLQLVCVDGENGSHLTVPLAKDKILATMLAEIDRLLTAGIVRDGRTLEPGDIAVLVRKHAEADAVRERLVQAGIPAVVRTDRSVLQTAEAGHFLSLLLAVLEPHKNGLVKAALVSPLFEYDAAGILEVDRDENEWQKLTANFHEWQEIWARSGFMRMFRRFWEIEEVKGRLLGLMDGERMVTNYQHIAECLHSAEYEKRLTPSTLVRWLREQMQRPEGDSDSYVIRLEKDEKAVQIVTIHRSKGLEYPIVFCPFNWTNVVGRSQAKEIIFHDGSDDNRLTWDLRENPDPDNVAACGREQLAEAIRLLYVAVTRARNRCYLFWAVTRDSAKADNCALAHAFRCGTDGPPAAHAAFNTVADGRGIGRHQWSGSEQQTKYRLPKAEPGGLAARVFNGTLPQGRLITSFSGMVARAHDEAPDRDVALESVPEPPPASGPAATASIFGFPKGAKAGNFFHAILEKLDFTRAEDLPVLVEKHLRMFRFDPSFAPVVTGKLQELLALDLPGGVKLAKVSPPDRLVEAPFCFPIQAVTPAELAEAFDRKDLPASFARGLGRLKFDPVDGYMTGFIDLVLRAGGRYYVIDWKSNWLGPTAGDYRGESLTRAMAQSHYFLQYHLYTLALHRHLDRTLREYDYERHFGGVFYVFLRGVEAADSLSGIYHDRPALELVTKLEGLLFSER